jgi:type IV secretion system protein VirB6
MGVVLSMLIMTAPPMAAMFFSGTLGSFVPYSQLTANAPARNQSLPQGYWPAAPQLPAGVPATGAVAQRVAHPIDAHAMSRLVGVGAAADERRIGPRD